MAPASVGVFRQSEPLLRLVCRLGSPHGAAPMATMASRSRAFEDVPRRSSPPGPSSSHLAPSSSHLASSGTSSEPLIGRAKRGPFNVEEFAQRPMTGLHLTDLFRVANNPSKAQMLLNAQFVWRELPIRYAHRVKQLRSLQFGLDECEQIQKAADSYTAHAQQMHDHPKPVDAETKASFNQLLRDTQPALLMVPGLIGEALAQRKLPESDKQMREQQRQIDFQLDAFFLARLGQRFLIEHYLATSLAVPGFSGIIQTNCSPVKVVERAAAEASFLCAARHGVSPHVEVHGDPLDTFTYVPAHIYFVASELIKNACAATVRFHTRADGGSSGGGTHGQGGLPPVKVIVVCGEHDVAIKVADKGGGIPRSKLADVWSYRGAKLSSGQCAAVPVGSDLIRAPEAPAGLGLAISRLHCKFFGGTLHLTPMEGYGTDAHAKLNRLGDDNCENLSQAVGQSFGMASVTRPGSIGLYDAQARR